ncbi:unnamed protein product [Clavelina lepadiformis]|uniref:Uronyl 2-sulfotransferase n=1 Tax=Clavelina lepadiformis TaxID=159417 RepID=A0ABP0FWT5_CLALP
MMKVISPVRLLVFCMSISVLFCIMVWNYISSQTTYAQRSGNNVNAGVYRFEDPTPSDRDFVVRQLEGINRPEDYFSRIVYNRVGKCGSRSMQAVISVLSKKNNFIFHLSPISNVSHLRLLDLKEEVRLITHLKPPMLYSRHIHYINFAKFGVQAPIYINLIRDPIERFSSSYHYKRYGDARTPVERRRHWAEGEKERSINDCILQNVTECSTGRLWYIVPYFCGQESICQRPSTYSLQRAKQRLLDNYLAVGILEDFQGTLKIFEKLMPYHFKGAPDIWQDISRGTVNNTSTVGKEKIRPEVYAILKERMAMEYEFYNFAVKRFYHVKDQLGIK